MLSSRQVLVVLVIARHRSITRAAAEISMSRSGLSRALTEVESALGTKLFDRCTMQTSLTPQGEFILPLLEQVHHLYENLRNIDGAPLDFGVD